MNIKITFLLLFIAVVPLIASFYFSINSLDKNVIPKLEERYVREAENVMLSTDIFLYGRYSDLQEFSNSPVLKSESSSPDQLTAELLEFRGDKTNFKSLSFFDIDGIKLSDTDNINVGQKSNLSQILDKLSDKKTVFLYSKGSNDDLSISSATLIENNNLPIGLLTADVSLGELKAVFQNLKGRVAFVDKEGNIIFTNDPLYKLTPKLKEMDSLKKISQGEPGVVYEENLYYNDDVLTAVVGERGYKDYKGSDLFLLYSVSSEGISPVGMLTKSYMTLGIPTVLIALAFSYFLSLEIRRPIATLKKITKEAMGGSDMQLPPYMKGEVGELMQYFGDMIKELNESKKQVEEYSKTLEQKVGARTKEVEKTKSAMINTMEDLTKTRERLKKSYSKLKELNEQKDKFISVAAHELKTPLAGIKGFTELLRDKKVISDSKKREDYLNIIINESNRLSNLVTEVLDLSRIDLGTVKYDFKKTNPEGIIEDAKKIMDSQIRKKGLKFESQIDKTLPSIVIDKDKFTQVLINLLSNAMKYTLQGKVMLRAYKDDGNLHVNVSDTGIGMSKEDMKKLFTRFYRIENDVTRKISGTGLGLSITKEYVEAMGGKIWVESEVGKGSSFHVVVPSGKNV